jgi:hypothetical protein
VDDVTCTVTDAACIVIGAPNVRLDLNGFTLTGLGDAETGCRGGPTAFVEGISEDGIYIRSQTGVTIRGPGLVQRFRGSGVYSSGSSGTTVTEVTASTNCFAGILIGGGSGHDLRTNVSVRNGNGNFACGGI